MTKQECAIFVSDLHITEPEGDRALLFLSLLNELRETKRATHLFLVGDIFDLWLGRHLYFQEKYKDIVSAISNLHKVGVRIHYFEGNHDLYLKEFWQEKIGIYVHENPELFEIAGYKILIEHGDQSDPEDKGYLFLRWLLRTPLLKMINRWLPENWIVAIGERASRKSREYTSHKKTVSNEKAIEKLRVHAKRQANKFDYDFLINGHVHVRDNYQFELLEKSRHSINLGTWLNSPGYLELSQTGAKFCNL